MDEAIPARFAADDFISEEDYDPTQIEETKENCE